MKKEKPVLSLVPKDEPGEQNWSWCMAKSSGRQSFGSSMLWCALPVSLSDIEQMLWIERQMRRLSETQRALLEQKPVEDPAAARVRFHWIHSQDVPDWKPTQIAPTPVYRLRFSYQKAGLSVVGYADRTHGSLYQSAIIKRSELLRLMVEVAHREGTSSAVSSVAEHLLRESEPELLEHLVMGLPGGARLHLSPEQAAILLSSPGAEMRLAVLRALEGVPKPEEQRRAGGGR